MRMNAIAKECLILFNLLGGNYRYSLETKEIEFSVKYVQPDNKELAVALVDVLSVMSPLWEGVMV